jgi:hypothetical protein
LSRLNYEDVANFIYFFSFFFVASKDKMDFTGQNSNPVVFDTSTNVRKSVSLDEEDDEVIDEVDTMEVFDLIRDIKDPEHEGSRAQILLFITAILTI